MTLLTPQISPLTRVREALLPIAILMACGVGLTNNCVDPDLWGHVQYGQDVLRDGYLHPTATYTYTAVGNRWINHENISELLFAIGMNTIGGTAMLWIKFALGMSVFAWFLRREWLRGAPPVAIGLVFLLGSLNLMHFWLIRPQLLSYLCLTSMLIVLQFVFAGWEGNWWLRRKKAADDPQLLTWSRLHWLWLLVPIQLIWTNSHGAFIAGGCIMAAYLVGRAAEIVIQFGRQGLAKAGCLMTILTSMLAVTFINPYGYALHVKLYHKLVIPRPEIIEWQPPEFFSVVWVQFWVLLAVWALAFCFAKKGRDLTQIAIVALVAWQATEHRRHIAFLALLSIAWLTPLVASAWERFQKQAESTDEPAKKTCRHEAILQVGCYGLMIILALGMFIDQLHTLPVTRDRYPVNAFEFIADRGLSREGKLIVQFEWAQYAIMAFGDRPNEQGLTVFFDGRFRTCYPQEILDTYWDFDMGPTPAGTRYRSPKSPPIDGHRVLTINNPDLVLAGRHRPAEIEVMQSHTDEWVLLYQDKLAQLWGRRDKYDNPHDPHYLPAERRSISENAYSGLVPFPAVPHS